MRTFSRIGGSMSAMLLLALSLIIVGCNIAGSKNDETAKIAVECGVDLKLTEKSGFVVDWNDIQQAWNVAVEEDRLVLTRRGMCGDECAFEDRIVLSGMSEDCPGFLSATVTTTDEGGALGPTTTTETALNGTLKIQDWDSDRGIVSGHLESEVVLTFFATMSKE